MVRTGIAGLLTSVALVGAATAADVNVRVEGAKGTLVPSIKVTPGTGNVTKNGKSCSANSGAGALELATAGDWTGTYYDGLGFTVDRIKTETYLFANNAPYWTFDVNGKGSAVGICDYVPNQGDELLFYPQCTGGTASCFSGDPLYLAVPATVKPGVPFNVTATQVNETTGARTAATGATIAGGAAAVTTGAGGVAAVTLSARGPQTLTVTKAAQVPNRAGVCVSDGADGYCGYQIPTPTPTAGPGTTATPVPTATPDTAKPVATIGLKAKYKKGKGPRTLTATVSDAGGLADVSLALTGKFGKVCKGFGNTKGKFRKVGCKRRLGFSVGSSPNVSFLLPKKLGKGAYTFLVSATDKAGNRSDTTKTFVVK